MEKEKCEHSPSHLNSTLTCGYMKEKCVCCGKQDIAYWCRSGGWGNIKDHKNNRLTMTEKTQEVWKDLTE